MGNHFLLLERNVLALSSSQVRSAKLSREQGQSAQPATRAIYTRLIDMTPADPDTMMTAMVQAQKLTKECGQEITIFTNDQ